MDIFLTASLDTNIKDEEGNKTAKNFGNQNSILDNLKSSIKKFDNFLFIASNPEFYEKTDSYFEITKQSMEMTLPFKNYALLDRRTKQYARTLVENADFIWLCGGHVPTQNKFFEEINIKELLKSSKAVVCGISAGSMNCAEIVYSQPEEEGEAIDRNYKRYFSGLGLTKLSILPHWQKVKDLFVDGISVLDISLEDSKNKPFLAIPDGSYVLCKDGKTTLYGEGYWFEDGKSKKICSDGEKVALENYLNKDKMCNL